MQPATDTELLHHTLDVDALVRINARHLQDESMLAKLNKEDVIVQETNNHIRCFVNVPLQPSQTSKGDNLSTKETSVLLISEEHLPSYRTSKLSQLVMLDSKP